MSEIQKLMESKLESGHYTSIESLIMMHRRKYPETCEQAAAELAELREAINRAYFDGAKEATRRFAYWAEGEQFVGTNGMTLQTALEEIEDEYLQTMQRKGQTHELPR